MTKKETIEMLKEIQKDLTKEIERSWWTQQKINTLVSAIKFLKDKKK